jgi:hypothetical protein
MVDWMLLMTLGDVYCLSVRSKDTKLYQPFATQSIANMVQKAAKQSDNRPIDR